MAVLAIVCSVRPPELSHNLSSSELVGTLTLVISATTCAFVALHACKHAYLTKQCTHALAHSCTHTRMHARTHTHMHAHMHIGTQERAHTTHARTNASTNARTRAHHLCRRRFLKARKVLDLRAQYAPMIAVPVLIAAKQCAEGVTHSWKLKV